MTTKETTAANIHQQFASRVASHFDDTYKHKEPNDPLYGERVTDEHVLERVRLVPPLSSLLKPISHHDLRFEPHHMDTNVIFDEDMGISSSPIDKKFSTTMQDNNKEDTPPAEKQHHEGEGEEAQKYGDFIYLCQHDMNGVPFKINADPNIECDENAELFVSDLSLYGFQENAIKVANSMRGAPEEPVHGVDISTSHIQVSVSYVSGSGFTLGYFLYETANPPFMENEDDGKGIVDLSKIDTKVVLFPNFTRGDGRLELGDSVALASSIQSVAYSTPFDYDDDDDDDANTYHTYGGDDDSSSIARETTVRGDHMRLIGVTDSHTFIPGTSIGFFVLPSVTYDEGSTAVLRKFQTTACTTFRIVPVPIDHTEEENENPFYANMFTMLFTPYDDDSNSNSNSNNDDPCIFAVTMRTMKPKYAPKNHPLISLFNELEIDKDNVSSVAQSGSSTLLESVRAIQQGTLRDQAQIAFSHHGQVRKGWLGGGGLSGQVRSNEVPCVVWFDGELGAMSFSNKISGPNFHAQMEVYINYDNDSDVVPRSEQARFIWHVTKRTAFKRQEESRNKIKVRAGDRISVYVRSVGDPTPLNATFTLVFSTGVKLNEDGLFLSVAKTEGGCDF